MAVTSQVRPLTAIGEVLIEDWQGAGLLKASVIKPVLATLEKRLIIKRLGYLQTADCEALKQAITSISASARGSIPQVSQGAVYEKARNWACLSSSIPAAFIH